MKHMVERTGLILKLLWTYVLFWTSDSLDEGYHTNLGSIYFDLGCYRKAISHFIKSEKKHGRRYPAYSKYNWYYLGYSFFNLGEFRSAVKYFKQYLVLNPEDLHTHDNLIFCYENLSEFDQALEAYSTILKKPSIYPQMHVGYSHLLFELGREAEALEQLKIASENIDNQMDRKVLAAQEMYIKGDKGNCVKLLKQVISDYDRNGNSSEIYSHDDLCLHLSQVQRKLSDDRGAIETLELALARHPKQIWLMNELAASYAENGVKLDKANLMMNKVLKQNPDNPFFWDTKGWILFKMNQPAESQKYLEKSLELNPNDKEVRSHLEAVTETLIKAKKQGDDGPLAS